MRSRILAFVAVGIVNCMAQVPSAQAAIVLGTFTGTITRGWDHGDSLGFGSGSGSVYLGGRSIAGTIVYDTDLAPADSDSEVRFGYYQSNSPASDPTGGWMSLMTVSIGGVDVGVPGIPDTIESFDADRIAIVSSFMNSNPGDDYVRFITDLEILGTSSGTPVYVDYATSVSMVSNDSGVDVPNDAIPTSLDFSGFGYGFGHTEIREWVGGSSERVIYAYFDLDMTDWNRPANEPVPEPAALAIWGAFVGLAIIAARRGRKSAV